jgi:hypothetical protein
MRRTTLYPALALAALLAACASEATMPLDGHQMGSGGRSDDWGTIGSGGRSNDWGTMGSGHLTGDGGGLGSGTGGFTTSDGGGMGSGGLTAEPDSSSTALGGHQMGSGH